MTFPDLGGVLSITIVPVAFGVTNPTEFSAQTLIIFGLPLCKSMNNVMSNCAPILKQNSFTIKKFFCEEKRPDQNNSLPNMSGSTSLLLR